MTKPNRKVCFQCPIISPPRPISVSFRSESVDKSAGKITGPRRFSFSTSSVGKPETVSFSAARCSEKGCVFPAASSGSGKCAYHMHQQEEPTLFRSHQPTGLLLDPARMAPTEKEYDGSRKRDRRRMAELWERFQSDGTP
jgi:hypothetical protein